MKTIVLLICTLQLSLFAFDSKLEGFTVGAAAGIQQYGYIETDDSRDVSHREKDLDFSPLAEIFLGYGNAKVLFLASASTSYLHSIDFTRADDNTTPEHFAKSIPKITIGGRFYPASQRVFKPQFYYGVEVGQIFLMEENRYQAQGIVFGFSTGYELRRHVSAELKLLGGGTSAQDRYMSYYAAQALFVFTAF
ncbi:hypothetical protein OAU52_00975 [bacterium]|nr:hypothetical protein [bacterium]